MFAPAFFSQALFFNAFAKFTAREVAVHFARPVALAFEFDAGWLVLEVNAGRGLVDLLSPATTAQDEFLRQVIFTDVHARHELSQDVPFGWIDVAACHIRLLPLLVTNAERIADCLDAREKKACRNDDRGVQFFA